LSEIHKLYISPVTQNLWCTQVIPDNKYVLVLNLGLRSIRAIVFDHTGKKLTHSWLPVRTFIKDEMVEQDPNEWWSLALRVIDEATTSQEIKDNLEYITVTSSSCNLVLVDEDKNSLGNSLMVSDKRSLIQAQQLFEHEPIKYLFDTHNILPVSSFLAPKILWIKDKDPNRFYHTKHFISSDSYLLMKLTNGIIVSDPLNAEKAFYYMPENKYPAPLLEYLGLTEKNFPQVKNVGTIIGKISPELKTLFAFNQNVSVVLTTYDALASFWGSGALEEGEACIVCGTCSSIRVYSKEGLKQKTAGLLSQYFENKNAHVVGGSNNLAGGLLEWAKDAFYQDVYSDNNDYIFGLMEQEANTSTLGAKGLIFLPYLIGERTPFFDSEVRGMFFGLERSHNRKDIIRSIYEAIGFLSWDIITSMERGGVLVRNLRLSGGLGKNELICQIKADITGKEVHLLDEVETTALGCFMLIASALGGNETQKVFPTNLSISKRFIPNLDNHIKYQQLYHLFKKLYKDNKENFKYRNELLKTINEKRKYEVKNL